MSRRTHAARLPSLPAVAGWNDVLHRVLTLLVGRPLKIFGRHGNHQP
jgi:hypothetical protein